MTGCTFATYVGGVATIQDDEEPGSAMMMFAPVREARVHETWDAVGLLGTGSHDVEFEDVFVPHELAYVPFDELSTGTAPWASLGRSLWVGTGATAAVQLGIGKRVIEEVRQVARVKPVSSISTAALITDGSCLRTLEYGSAVLYAQERAMEAALSTLWDAASHDDVLEAERLTVGAAGRAAVHEAKRIVDMVWELAGTRALPSAHVLNRLVRDAQCMPVHVYGQRRGYEIIGRIREGESALRPFV